jgi:hypothetical protein
LVQCGCGLYSPYQLLDEGFYELGTFQKSAQNWRLLPSSGGISSFIPKGDWAFLHSTDHSSCLELVGCLSSLKTQVQIFQDSKGLLPGTDRRKVSRMRCNPGRVAILRTCLCFLGLWQNTQDWVINKRTGFWRLLCSICPVSGEGLVLYHSIVEGKKGQWAPE